MRKLIMLAATAAALAVPSGASADTTTVGTACKPDEPLTACAARIVREAPYLLYCAGSCIPGCSGDLLAACVVKKARPVCEMVFPYCGV
jgi:curli biogenesis system outer membrane secretion channel CsgG